MAIATLIAAGRLDDRLIDRSLGMLREVDPKASFFHWIDEGDAADLRFTGDMRAARWALERLDGVDVIVQDDEPRWRKLLVADMDSTIIDQECIDELADYAGLKDRVARITDSAMRGEIEFAESLHKRVQTLAGLERAHAVLQAQLARELRMKRTPQLAFEYDPSVERGVRMNKLIDELAPDDSE